MTATFYNLNKRQDSTKVPTGSGTDITVNLKNGADFDNPVFEMQTNVTGYNYMLWNGHYYFITGRKYIHNQFFEISCTIDALGTCRSDIMSSSQYVLRTSNSSLANHKLIDNAYPAETEPNSNHYAITMGIDNTGCYVLSVKSDKGIQYFIITLSQLQNILDQIMATKQEDLWSTISDLVGSLGPSLLNASDYIIGVRWMPFSVPSGTAYPIVLGYWATGISAPEASTRFNFVSAPGGEFTLTVHPETDSTKEFLNCAQYHGCTVFVPGCGEIPIDFGKVQGTSIKVSITVDISGAVTAIIKNTDGEILGRSHGVLGAEVPITASNVGAGGIGATAAGIGTVVGALATAGASGFAAAMGEAAEGAIEIGTGIAASIPDVNTSGGAGSYLVPAGADMLRVQEWMYPITEQAPVQNGYPCMKVMTLGTAGFYQIKNPQVDFGDDLYIKNQIESYMARGFYVE